MACQNLEKQRKMKPTIRFNLFSDDYSCSKIDDVIALGKTKYSQKKSGKELIDIELDSIEENTGKLLKTYNSKDYESTKSVFSSKDVLYGKLRPYLRKYFLPDFDGVCSTEFWVLKPVLMTQEYLYYYVQTSHFSRLCNKTCGTKMPRADWSLIKQNNVYYPSTKEMEMVSSLMKCIDYQTSAIEQKLDLIEKYEDGLVDKMQNDSLETIKLRDILCVIPPEKGDKNSKIPYLEIGDIEVNKNKYSLDADKKPLSSKIGNVGDIVISTVRPTRGAVCILRDKVFLSTALYNIKVDESIRFSVLALLQSWYFKKRMHRWQCGTSYPSVSTKDIDEFEFKYGPCFEKFNDVFEKLESIKNNLYAQLNLLNNMKTTFLNQLFINNVVEE